MPPPPPPLHSNYSNNKPPLIVPADHEAYPFIRSLANYAASKLSSLSESDISLLSDDALTRLIESEFDRLSEDELNRLADAARSPFLPIVEAMFASISPPVISQPKNEEKEYSEEPHLSEFLLSFITSLLQCFAFMTVIVTTVTLFQIFFKRLGKRLSSPKRSRRDVIVTITPQENLKPSKRSIYLSKYSRTLDLKGLKGIRETYIQETDTGFR